MAAKKDNLPLNLEQDQNSTGIITYANEVIAVISGVAANEVEGIAGMCSSGGMTEFFTRNKNITKGVKVEIGSEEASVDLYVVVEYGTPIQTAAQNVQENVRKAIETMTGLHVVRIDVHVQGVSFEKETKETLAGLESAAIEEPMRMNEEESAKSDEEHRTEWDTIQDRAPFFEATDAETDTRTDAETDVFADMGIDVETGVEAEAEREEEGIATEDSRQS